ncbi:MAG: glycosyltransferase family 9 protein [Pseudomonadota bacterium]
MKQSRIVVIHFGALGDVILSLPAMQAIRDYYPGTRIVLVGNMPVMDLIAPDLNADQAYSSDLGRFAALFAADTETADYSRVLGEFETVFYFARKPDSPSICNLRHTLSEKVRIIPCLPPPGDNTHVAYYQLGALMDLGDNRGNIPTALKMGSQRYSLGRIWRNRPVDSPGVLAGIHPGSGGTKKCWPKEDFLATVRGLVSDGTVRCLVFLGPAEESWTEDAMRAFGRSESVTLIREPLQTVAELLSQCRVYIGNDSGITHLASALGIPTIALFGPTDPRRWRPVGKSVCIIASELECVPCESTGYQNCESLACLRSISVDKVLEQAKQQLKGSGGRPECVD